MPYPPSPASPPPNPPFLPPAPPQAMWYEVAAGRAYAAAGAPGPALKRFLKVHAHFEDFQEDQFDFHGYCVRKMVGGSGRGAVPGEERCDPGEVPEGGAACEGAG